VRPETREDLCSADTVARPGGARLIKTLGRRKKQSFLPPAGLVGVRGPEEFQQRIESLLMQELENRHGTEALELKAIELKKRLDRPEIEAHKGRILIIDDEPAVGSRIGQWMALEGYHHTFVSNDDEASDFLEHGQVDAVVRSSEFFFPQHSWAHRLLRFCRLRRD